MEPLINMAKRILYSVYIISYLPCRIYVIDNSQSRNRTSYKRQAQFLSIKFLARYRTDNLNK